MTHKLLILALGVSSVALGACDVHTSTYLYDDHPRRVGGGPPVYVDQGPQYVVVRRPVPPPRREVIVASPGPDWYWVGGYWEPAGNDWNWRGGHYERRPRPQAVWVPPRYENRGDEVHFSVGVWR